MGLVGTKHVGNGQVLWLLSFSTALQVNFLPWHLQSSTPEPQVHSAAVFSAHPCCLVLEMMFTGFLGCTASLMPPYFRETGSVSSRTCRSLQLKHPSLLLMLAEV